MKNKLNKFNKIIISLVVIISLLVPGCSSKNIKQYIHSIIPFTQTNEQVKNLKDTKSSSNIENQNASVSELISQIEVKEASGDNYDRDDYTSETQRYTFNGKKYTSIRSFAFYASSNYSNSIYISPYDGKTYKIRQMDYDHLIPLCYANKHGASKWTNEQKKAYADNPNVGIDVSLHDNRIKGDKGPSEWLPKENIESYCYSWLVLAKKYNLSIAPEDMKVIKEKLNNVTISQLKIINKYNN